MNQSQLAYHAPLRQYVHGNSPPSNGLLATMILANFPEVGSRQPGTRNAKRQRITAYDPTVELYPARYSFDAGSDVAFQFSNSPALQCRDGAPRPFSNQRTIGRRNGDDREPGEIIGDEEPRNQDELDEDELQENAGALAIPVYT
jgi:hypothetical protein